MSFPLLFFLHMSSSKANHMIFKMFYFTLCFITRPTKLTLSIRYRMKITLFIQTQLLLLLLILLQLSRFPPFALYPAYRLHSQNILERVLKCDSGARALVTAVSMTCCAALSKSFPLSGTHFAPLSMKRDQIRWSFKDPSNSNSIGVFEIGGKKDLWRKICLCWNRPQQWAESPCKQNQPVSLCPLIASLLPVLPPSSPWHHIHGVACVHTATVLLRTHQISGNLLLQINCFFFKEEILHAIIWKPVSLAISGW